MTELDWFWELTDEEIYVGIIARHQPSEFEDTCKYAWKHGFRKMSEWWSQCEGDRTLMKLQYADELIELNEMAAIHNSKISQRWTTITI